jgi:hypothetical protein
MRKIFLAALACMASVVSAAKNSVMAYTGASTLLNSNIATASFDYSVDFGYVMNTALTYPDDNSVQTGATLGLYSTIDLIFKTNLLGLELYNLKITITPLTFNPVSASLTFTHPLAMAEKGAQMEAAVDLGYSLTLGDISTHYYINSLLPKVSILDMIYPAPGSGIYYPALPAFTVSGNANGVKGWDWNADQNGAWTADPYFKFNLGDFINSNVEGVDIPTTGSFFNYDFFAEAKEYM